MKKVPRNTRWLLDRKFETLRGLPGLELPQSGWIRSIRLALGMTTTQLAQRMGVTAQRVRYLEQSESAGTITLRSLQRAAAALNCNLVHLAIPQQSLQTLVEVQARKKARAMMERASQTMTLEAQGLSAEMNRKIESDLISELINTTPRTLWDE